MLHHRRDDAFLAEAYTQEHRTANLCVSFAGMFDLADGGTYAKRRVYGAIGVWHDRLR